MYLYIFSTFHDLWNVNGQQHTFDFLWTGSSLVAGKDEIYLCQEISHPTLCS